MLLGTPIGRDAAVDCATGRSDKIMIRKLKEWTAESERAVSPVIGVILMVAITVILAAVIGSFVLGIGGDIEETPQATLGVEASANATGSGINVTLSHDGGDPLTGSNLRVVADNSTTDFFDNSSIDRRVTVGDRVTFSGGSSVPAEVDVRVIHQPSDSLLLDTTVRVE